jgi:hypothetical protein
MVVHDRWEKQKNNTSKIKEGEVAMEKKIKFQVGDEVKDEYGFYAVVIRTDVGGDESQMYVVFPDGSSGKKSKDGWGWTKTGRRFPQIVEVLEMMNKEE